MKTKFFKLAKLMSNKSTSTYKVGAVIVQKNRVIGLGFNNMTKTHTRSTHPFKSIHAELSAILNSRQEDLSNCEIYVYRENKDGLAKARPCKYCLQLIQQVGIDKIYYTWDNEYIEEQI